MYLYVKEGGVNGGWMGGSGEGWRKKRSLRVRDGEKTVEEEEEVGGGGGA